MDPFLASILTGLGAGAAQGGIAQMEAKKKKKGERQLREAQDKESLAELINSLLDRQTETQAIDVSRSLRGRGREGNDMMSAAAMARRSLGV